MPTTNRTLDEIYADHVSRRAQARYSEMPNMLNVEPRPYEANPVRGCGRRVRGGSYLEVDTVPTGILGRLSWVLGHHWNQGGSRERVTLFTQVPPRAMMVFNPAATLAEGKVVTNPRYDRWTNREVKRIAETMMAIVGDIGLLDYVGARYYSPWSFAKEVYEHGPSRRVTRDFLRRISPYLPLPVFFAHRNIPYFPTSARAIEALDVSCQLLNVSEARFMRPTWEIPGWGLTANDVSGDNHYMVPVLKAYDEFDSTFEDDPRFHDVKFAETLFAASWFTRGAYVLRDDDDPGIDAINVVNLTLDV